MAVVIAIVVIVIIIIIIVAADGVIYFIPGMALNVFSVLAHSCTAL